MLHDQAVVCTKRFVFISLLQRKAEYAPRPQLERKKAYITQTITAQYSVILISNFSGKFPNEIQMKIGAFLN